MGLALFGEDLLDSLFGQLLVFAEKTDFICKRFILFRKSSYLTEVNLLPRPIPLALQGFLEIRTPNIGCRDPLLILTVATVSIKRRFLVRCKTRGHEFHRLLTLRSFLLDLL